MKSGESVLVYQSCENSPKSVFFAGELTTSENPLGEAASGKQVYRAPHLCVGGELFP